MGCCFAIFVIASTPRSVWAWGDLGHEVIARIADHYLEPAVRSRVATILAGDRSRLTAGTDIEAEATWADKYRDSDRNTTRVRYSQTRNWHFVDLEIDAPDLSTACFGQPPPPKKTASSGPAADCIVDKLDEFVAELGSRATSRKERLLALQFVLHLIGDVHQPLHASDEHDEGGNLKLVAGPGLPSGHNLHAAWDVAFVEKLGDGEAQIARRLIEKITPAQRLAWSSGKPSQWALESFELARQHAYALPAPSSMGRYELSAAYISDAATVAGEQLSKAGVRLAYVLNQSLR